MSPKRSWLGVPFAKGTKRCKRGSFFCPNRAMSVNPSAPARIDMRASNRNLVEPMGHLARLPMVRHVFEIIEKNSGLEIPRRRRRQNIHPPAPLTNQRMPTEFSTSALCHELPSPDCPDRSSPTPVTDEVSMIDLPTDGSLPDGAFNDDHLGTLMPFGAVAVGTAIAGHPPHRSRCGATAPGSYLG